MRVRSLLSTTLLLLGTASSIALPVSARAAENADQPSSRFSVQEKTLIPGAAIAPGSYSIKILDHLSDRMVLQVENEQGKLLATFLALPNTRMQRTGAPGVISFPETTKNPALRGFQFSNGSVVEFVYPKAQAVAIARQNSTRVPAIDPVSEGMPGDNRLSRNDMALVTLWMLSPTLVGSETKPSSVLAERYQAPAASQQDQVQLAQAARPVPPQAASAPATPDQPVLMAKVTRKPVLSRLPHTAGVLPLVWLLGFISLIGGIVLRFSKENLQHS